MGLTYAEITLANGAENALFKLGRLPEAEVKQVKVTALVDSGTFMLAINENIKSQLELPVYEKRNARLADGSIVACEIVGPVDVFFKNRRTTCEAVVLPGDNEVLLGAIPIEGMDVLIDLKNNELIVHPDRPYVAGTVLKPVV